MADDVFRIACASSDGDNIDRHFGRADRFEIIEVHSEDEIEFIETRQVSQVCGENGHNDRILTENTSLLSDCKYVIAARIGPKALCTLENAGIDAFEIAGPIDEAVMKLYSHIKINALLEGIF